jgi:hypothetical protein
MFKSWCAARNFNHATNLSHVLMDGGVLSVPFDKLNDFHEKYIESVKGGERLYVVEQKSEKYNFSHYRRPKEEQRIGMKLLTLLYMEMPVEKQKGVVLECHGLIKRQNMERVTVEDARIVRGVKLTSFHISPFMYIVMDP